MYVLFDIGGTKTRVAISGDCQSFGEPVKYETPESFEEGVKKLGETARELLGGKEAKGVAGGIRGPLQKDKETILSDTKLTDWVQKPIRKTIEDTIGAPTRIENDAAMVGLGEAHFGAGRGHDIAVYHTVSTGVGGARIDHGKIDATSVGFEPGKQVIDPDGTLCPECESGMLEDLISGTALEKRRGVKPYDISQDDPVWKELATWFAYGLKNTIVYWSPDVIVLGGSMIVGDPRILHEDIVSATAKVLGGVVPCPPILDAKLGDYGGLYGAMVLLKQEGIAQ